MTNQFSPKVSEILAYSREEAARLASQDVAPEHLLLGMMRMKEGPVADLFQRMNIDMPSIKSELESRVRVDDFVRPNYTQQLMLNDNASNILKLAVLESRLQRAAFVDVQHVLLAILHDAANNGAKQILEMNNMNYNDTLNMLSVKDGIGLPEEDYEEEENTTSNNSASNGSAAGKGTTTAQTKQTKSKTPVLDNFGTDLTQLALQGALDPCVGRQDEIQRVIEILGRRKKNNPILIGEPGVGKSAIVEGLAQMIATHHCSPMLFNKRLVTLDMTGVVAGTKYRGQFEERMKMLVKELEQNPDIIIFIDEIHTMIGAGSAAGTMDAANILKPALARGTIQCIGATTLDEYRNSIEKDGALERRFQKVLIEPTTPEQTLEILHNIKEMYEKHHGVNYTDEALKACVTLTERYISDRFFPDKAIDAMDEAGSRVHITKVDTPKEIEELEQRIAEAQENKYKAVQAQNFESAAGYRDQQEKLKEELQVAKQRWEKELDSRRVTVNEGHIAEVVAMMTGVPTQRIAQSEGIRLLGMTDELKKQVIGQDEAIDKIARSIRRNRAGLRDPKRPIGSFMFLGPTGVGKTLLAKKLAQFLFNSDEALIRVDMSEYMEKFNVSRLVGAPPGYVGYEEGGQLTEKVRRHPYSVVLLDEIEKAHPDVFNMLLQVLDEGNLTDGLGRKVDFKNTIIIMTSNIGTRELKDFGAGVGFNTTELTKERSDSVIRKALNRQFSPEFLNRVDDIVTFGSLNHDCILKIVDIELASFYKRVEENGLKLEITDAAKNLVADHGFDIQYGARPLKRAIQSEIEDPLSEMLLREEASNGDTIVIDVQDGNIVTSIKKATVETTTAE